MPFNTYRPDLMGEAKLDTEGPLECGEWTSLKLTYTAGHFGIDDLGGIKIAIRQASDQMTPQFDNPTAPGYTTITASNGARLKYWSSRNRNIRPWSNTLYIQCLNFLSEGDTITLKFGDRSQGSPGIRMQTFREDAFEYRVHVDAFSTYDYSVLPSDRQPKIDLVPGPASMHKVVLPTLRFVEDTFAVGVKAEDRWGNPTAKDANLYHLRPSRPVQGLPETVSMSESKGGVIRLDGLKVSEPGDLHIDLVDETGKLVVQSNTLRVVENFEFRHYWSDMHGQSGETVGTNTAREYFEFGRDKALIDICGHQGNDFQITDTFWKELNELTLEFNEPGRYLAIPGYEWSGNTSVGGDHNVWFRDEERPIYRAQRSLVMDDSTDENTCIDAKQLFEKLQKEDALVVAHVGGRYADVSFAHDANLEPSVEVHSSWGTFDWIFEDAYKSGYRVGIVAASDGHKGRIGASYPGSGKFGSMGGLTCHLMPSLDRDSLFTAFRRRRHYATTGCRSFLDVRIENLENAIVNLPGGATEKVETAHIGDILTCSNNEVDLQFDISGHTGIERVEIRDGLSAFETIQPQLEQREAGNRIRIQCEGAEYKGRGRLVNWDVQVQASDTQVQRVEPVNFWNPDHDANLDGNLISWQNVTTGGVHAVDVWFDQTKKGKLELKSNQTEFSLNLTDVGTEDVLFECGGLRKAVRVTRLPEERLDKKLHQKVRIPLEEGKERCLFLRITFEDGHIAWTSPIYVTRKSNS